MNAIDWLHPIWLWLAAPVAVLPWLLPRLGLSIDLVCLRGQGLLVRLPSLAVTNPHRSSQGSEQTKPARPLQQWVLSSCLLLMCVALAQPVRDGAPIPTKPSSEPVDAWLLVSTSVSMVLRDYTVDGQTVRRMHMARELLTDFSHEFKGNRVGLAVLGHPPAVWLPPTSDRQLLRHYLEGLEPTLGGRFSALGDGLALLARESVHEGSEERIVIVLTDAGLEVGELSPTQGLQLAANAGLRVYFVVLGKTEIEYEESAISDGLLYQSADIESLQRLAAKTGGEVFHATDTQVVEDALAHIQAKHRRSVYAKPGLNQRQVLYFYPLVLVALIMLLWPLWVRRR